mgnify:CR=1 FL=1
MTNFKYPARVSFNPEDYSANLDNDKLIAKFGLPAEVKYCKNCTISNQRPNSALEYAHHAGTIKKSMHVDDDGICDSCRHADNKKYVIDTARIILYDECL